MHLASSCDRVLRSIHRLSQVSVTFSIFEELFVLWLDYVSTCGVYQEVCNTRSVTNYQANSTR